MPATGGGGSGYTTFDIGACGCPNCSPCALPTAGFTFSWNITGGTLVGSGSTVVPFIGSSASLAWATGGGTSCTGYCWDTGGGIAYGTNGLSIGLQVACSPGCTVYFITFYGGGHPSAARYLNYGTCTGCAKSNTGNAAGLLSASCGPLSVSWGSTGTINETYTITP